ncbi:HET-domain-containing protein, partial [Macroventuria anomochaeta]
MHLLQIGADGEFSLTEFYGKQIPEYAILSHTWIASNEEVSFKELVKGRGKGKAGYRKLHFCAEQAVKDQLQYFWVDTCCIDKASSAELQEAINSMFRWYQKAKKCYVYLADVHSETATKIQTEHGISSEQASRLAFRRSRWFTRGWTLQELIAPKSVDFFSAQGKWLGDRVSLWKDIHQVTNIPFEALQKEPVALSQFTVDQRLSWAENRETTREEDKAYSLLGIFDLSMPLLYGEGQTKALMRLHQTRES